MDQPHLVTQVETAPAIQQDHLTLVTIQAALADKDLPPSQQLVDVGYVSAKRILHSREVHGIDLVGPVHNGLGWQARTPGAFDITQFVIACEQQMVVYPLGKQSTIWQLSEDAQGESTVQIVFVADICRDCPVRVQCTTATRIGRSFPLGYPRERHEMLQTAREQQQTQEFKFTYAKRESVEKNISQAARRCGLGQACYMGFDKTRLQNIACATAANPLQIIDWLNEISFAHTRMSRFAALAN